MLIESVYSMVTLLKLWIQTASILCEWFLSFLLFFIFNRLLEVLDTISHTLDLENQSSMQFLRENILIDVFDVTSMTSPVIGIQIEAGKAQSLTTSNIQNLMADRNITIGKIDAAIILPVELINSEFCFVKLTSSLRKLYGRHHDIVDRYGVSVSQMTTDMFHL